MLAFVFLVVGAVFGWVRAARRGGSTADKWQYAAAHGIAFGLVGMAVGLILVRSGLFPTG